MTDALTQVVVWLNTAANALGRALGFVALLPGWLSATLIAVVSGMAMLIAFRHTSAQGAIKGVRQGIRANLLAARLFHDSLRVGFAAQGRVLLGAMRLLLLAIVPILAMLVPMVLLLGQLALWYQARPLKVGEEAVITLKLDSGPDAPWPRVQLEPTDAVEDKHGPVRVISKREICWNVRARQAGYHHLVFLVNGKRVEKELAVGDGFMSVSMRRPDWDWADALLHPRESPFGPDSPVRSIEVQYPTRSSWTSGTNSWVYYWFAVSLVTGFCLRGVFKVNL
jgi:hypothetical protein